MTLSICKTPPQQHSQRSGAWLLVLLRSKGPLACPNPEFSGGHSTGRIWLDNVSCGGHEKSIAECQSRGWGNSDCSHEEDAGVVCKDERIAGFTASNVIEVSWPRRCSWGGTPRVRARGARTT